MRRSALAVCCWLLAVVMLPSAAFAHASLIASSPADGALLAHAPATLTLKPGEKVTWINKDLVPHTASAVSKAFDSGVIAAGASWTYTVREAGSSAYVCLFHPTMQGTLIAQ